MEKAVSKKNRNVKTKSRKKRVLRKGAFFWLLVMIIAGGILWRQQNNTINLMEVFQQEPVQERQEAIPLLTYNPSEPNYFGIYEKDLIYSSKDGIKRLTLDGSIIWSQAYSMKKPYLVVSTPYVGVGDIGGQDIYIFEGKGLLYSIKAAYPILEFILTEQGWVGVLQQTPTGHQVSIYDPKGNIQIDHITYLEKDGQPMSIFISPNGEQLVTSYVDTYSSEILSKLTFFNIGALGELQIDSITGAHHYSNMLIPLGKFFDSNTFVAISEQKLMGFDVNTNPVEIWNYAFTQKVRRVSAKGSQSVALAFGDPLPGETGEQQEITRIYNQQGKILGEFITKEPVDYLHHTDSLTIIGAGRTFYGITSKGKQLWEYKATKDIKAFLPFGGNKSFLLVSQDQVEWIDIY
ncbi:MAG: hypothetical protein GX962_01350 [Epulopiscium sp.]|nr:hypothetical protein [Candidatus Epulonipiscium sp.]